MAKVWLLFVTACVACAIQPILGNNYYGSLLQYIPPLDSGTLLGFAPVLQPDCSKEKAEGSSKEEGKSGEEKKEGSEEGKESKKEGSKEEGSKEEGSKEEGSKEEGSKEEGSKEEGSKEEGSKKEGSKEEGSKEEGGNKMKSTNMRYIFPPTTYSFPPKQVQQVMYAPASTYSYLPYRSSYVVQQPIASYSVQPRYQYMSLPTAQTYSVTPYVGRTITSPVTKILYSSSSYFNYPGISKSIVTPGAQVYPNPGIWNSQFSYYKK